MNERIKKILCSSTIIYTWPGYSASNLKWWYFLMPGRFLKKGWRCCCQSPTGTKDVPSSLPINWAWFTQALSFTTVSNSCSDDTAWRLNAFLRRPKHPSGANFVWPGIKKFNEIDLWSPVHTLHAQYHRTKRFLFCSEQLSQWSCALVSPRPKHSKKWFR